MTRVVDKETQSADLILATFWSATRKREPNAKTTLIRHRGIALALVVSATVAVSCLGLVGLLHDQKAGSASGQPTPPMSSAERTRVQEVLDDLANQVLEVPDASGYAGSSIDVDSMSLTIQWKKPVPEAVLKLAGRDPASGATVTIDPVLYSQDDVKAAASRVFARVKDAGLVQPNVIGRLAVGSGLRIEVRPQDLEMARTETARFEEIAHMHVEFVAGMDGPPQPAGGSS